MQKQHECLNNTLVTLMRAMVELTQVDQEAVTTSIIGEARNAVQEAFDEAAEIYMDYGGNMGLNEEERISFTDGESTYELMRRGTHWTACQVTELEEEQ